MSTELKSDRVFDVIIEHSKYITHVWIDSKYKEMLKNIDGVSNCFEFGKNHYSITLDPRYNKYNVFTSIFLLADNENLTVCLKVRE